MDGLNRCVFPEANDWPRESTVMSVARRRKSATAHVRLANVALLAIGVLTVLSAVLWKVLCAAFDLNISLILAWLAAFAASALVYLPKDEHIETTHFQSA